MASATSTYAKIVHVVDSFSVNNNKSITPTVLDCHLHGWQWHCMSVLREMKVLQTLVQQTNDDNDDDDKTNSRLQQVHVYTSLADYVIGLNV